MTESKSAIAPRDLIAGLGKGLALIEAFDDAHPRLAASEAAARTGMTRTAARRFLLSLVHFGYAETDGRQYWLAPRILRLGQSFLDAARLPRQVQPFVQRASLLCGETVNFSVLDGHEVVYLVRSNAPRLVSIGYHVGARVPAHVVTPGIVILSTFADAALDAWLAGHDFSSFTAFTITDPALLRVEIELARAQDYWSTGQQLELGLIGIAVPLKDRRGECRGAVSCTFQAHAYSPEQVLSQLLPALREAVQALRPLI